jgi:hypothetical protein
MSDMSRVESATSTTTTARIPSFVLMIIFITLALSLTALISAVSFFTSGEEVIAGYLLLIGALGLAFSTYMLLQTRRRMSSLRIEVPPIMSTIECKKCGFKNVREFQRGDYVFKEVEPCQKCSDKMLITAIYREVKEKDKEKERSSF